MTLPPHSSKDEWPIKADKTLDFLNSDPARNIRVLCEMTEPGLRFAEQNVEDTIVLFGSARTKPIVVAEKELAAIKDTIKDPENLTPEEKRSLQQAEYAWMGLLLQANLRGPRPGHHPWRSGGATLVAVRWPPD